MGSIVSYFKIVGRRNTMRKILITVSSLMIFIQQCESMGIQTDVRTLVEITCSACTASAQQRLVEQPTPICCRCIDEKATCNNDMAEEFPNPRNGATCIENTLEECDDVFDDCCQNTIDSDTLGLRQSEAEPEFEGCPLGFKSCCNPVDNHMFNDPSEFSGVESLCNRANMVATQDFRKGVSCGKRDSAVFYDADLPESFTNPGEWPWAVMIYDGDKYIGAGALVDNNVVVTAAHKVRDYTRSDSLIVVVGEWNPNTRDEREEYPEVKMRVECVRLHPEADLGNPLANNVAVLRLGEAVKPVNLEQERVAGVITLRQGAEPLIERPGDKPEGVEGSNKVEAKGLIDLRLGLISVDRNQNPLGEDERPPTPTPGPTTRGIPPSYINTVCLPRPRQNFEGKGNCWVASWGTNLERQREVDLPILSTAECTRQLRPEFEARNVRGWTPKPSEICAGGAPLKDTCRGEGGAPLVCYDPDFDQFYLLGLVGYGFKCNEGMPGVYTNMADPGVKDFVTSAFGSTMLSVRSKMQDKEQNLFT